MDAALTWLTFAARLAAPILGPPDLVRVHQRPVRLLARSVRHLAPSLSLFPAPGGTRRLCA